MGLNIPSEGFQNSQAYQTPGLPFVIRATAPAIVNFPQVTRSIHITANGSDVGIAFAPAAAPERVFTITSNTTVELPVRIRDLYLVSGTMSCFAALTTIPRKSMPNLLAVNWEGIA